MWNPWSHLAEKAAKAAADAWTATMLSLWQAGLWVLRVVLKFESHVLTPDLSETGPAGRAYQTTYWIAAALVLLMGLVQLATVLARRDGRSLARLVTGTAQFMLVWGSWLGYAVAVLTACGGLNDALMNSLLSVRAWDAWQPLKPLSGKDLTDPVLATVLGGLGAFLWVAAVAHFIVLMARSASLLVLAATTPIAAAGLVSETGRPWFWKSLRWFHAAALAPVLMTLIMGLGVQLATGVALGLAAGAESSIGTAVPAVFMILISAVAPVALFKLLAFVDPGTSSGAAVRTGLAATGGLAGLVGRQGGHDGGGSDTAAQTDRAGRARGEAMAESATTARFAAVESATTSGPAAAAGGALGLVGSAGTVLAEGIHRLTGLGGTAAALFTDGTNQLGIGHNTYQPDIAPAAPPGDTRRTPGRTDDTVATDPPAPHLQAPDESSDPPRADLPHEPAPPAHLRQPDETRPSADRTHIPVRSDDPTSPDTHHPSTGDLQ